ncbi:transmembrane protein, putative (macronuclear) [Tetrahymena thermophila SB210]|uniref:Transmembrane protein, putative n=1 Tax=Tetrahymena thermophila (strain SB210) TaxID=312017 RepID=Q23BL5_TETTS|nr:transmembrane protein, putative [Tetrahymena thermophila SB210]EAR94103.1 transmembrane protein, putative [Tetrahymena thermophila SB210]|eukprot:XP_001014348.1 transmembrane protein, putative [Tetrahymena thermophila SB210]
MRKIASILILISITLFTVRASQCSEDIMNQINNGTVCQSSDNACKTALDTFIKCVQDCSKDMSSNSVIKICSQVNCSNISNDTVKALYNKMVACFDSVLIFSALFVLVALLF